MKYNYIFFNASDSARRRNPDGYYTICVEDLERMDGVHVVSYPVDYAPYFVRFLFSAHNTKRLNKWINLPFKKLWYPYYFKNPFTDDKPLCFIVGTGILPVSYIQYLRTRYPKCKLVIIHRDLISLWQVQNPDFPPEVVDKLFDLKMSHNKAEAEKYKIPYFTSFESKIAIPKAPNYPLSDVFFAGVVKDRLSKLMKIYDILTAAGIKVNYYLTGVSKEQQVPRAGVEYAKRQMPYREMLYRTVNSKCVLEINRGGSIGYTSRFFTAVIYGKKLITNNLFIKESKFYNPQYIHVLDAIEDINPDFIKENLESIDYHYNGEFSPIHLIEQIDEILSSFESA